MLHSRGELYVHFQCYIKVIGRHIYSVKIPQKRSKLFVCSAPLTNLHFPSTLIRVLFLSLFHSVPCGQWKTPLRISYLHPSELCLLYIAVQATLLLSTIGEFYAWHMKIQPPTCNHCGNRLFRIWPTNRKFFHKTFNGDNDEGVGGGGKSPFLGSDWRLFYPSLIEWVTLFWFFTFWNVGSNWFRVNTNH